MMAEAEIFQGKKKRFMNNKYLVITICKCIQWSLES